VRLAPVRDEPKARRSVTPDHSHRGDQECLWGCETQGPC